MLDGLCQASIFEMLRELFEAAVSQPPPQGLAHSPQSRSMYAVDLMLKWDTTASGRCLPSSSSSSSAFPAIAVGSPLCVCVCVCICVCVCVCVCVIFTYVNVF